MTFTEKYKAYIIGALGLIGLLVLLLLLGEIILPFIFAIFIAYLLNPTINKIQKVIKNRNVAISVFLFVVTLVFVGVIVFFGGHLVKDSKRFVGAVETFTHQNESEINEFKTNVMGWVDDVYESETVKNLIESADTLSTEEKEESAMSAINSVYSLFEGPSEAVEEAEEESWSAIYMIAYTLVYTGFILYSFEYFEEKYKKYFGNNKPITPGMEGVWKDYQEVFLKYLKQRGKVVMLNILVLIIAFSILDLPGAIIIGIITGLLSYASHFHYLSLPLVGIGCWVLSIENDAHFFLYFGIILAVYILISILDETIYFSKIMKSVNGMNPAIMLLSFTLWIYIFGSFTGTIIALPLTQLILVYLDKVILYSRKK